MCVRKIMCATLIAPLQGAAACGRGASATWRKVTLLVAMMCYDNFLDPPGGTPESGASLARNAMGLLLSTLLARVARGDVDHCSDEALWVEASVGLAVTLHWFWVGGGALYSSAMWGFGVAYPLLTLWRWKYGHDECDQRAAELRASGWSAVALAVGAYGLWAVQYNFWVRALWVVVRTGIMLHVGFKDSAGSALALRVWLSAALGCSPSIYFFSYRGDGYMLSVLMVLVHETLVDRAITGTVCRVATQLKMSVPVSLVACHASAWLAMALLSAVLGMVGLV